tara:strand:- start:75 stop:788 length:714 start_codon:yes stop_codon:yes gene_type:complete
MSSWNNLKKQIRDEFRAAPENFLFQPVIRKCLHPGPSRYNKAVGDDYYKQLKKWHDLPKEDPKLGNPRIIKNGRSLVTLQSAYYIKLMNDRFTLKEIDVIYDVGGGYGNMCRIIREMGYTGDYVLIDFPELQEIQKYYLENLGLKVSMNVAYKKLEDRAIRPKGNSLLIATHSMNEMPLEDRPKVNIDKFSKFFIAYNEEFDGIDNIEYFKQFKDLPHKTEYLQNEVQDQHRFLIGY